MIYLRPGDTGVFPTKVVLKGADDVPLDLGGMKVSVDVKAIDEAAGEVGIEVRVYNPKADDVLKEVCGL